MNITRVDKKIDSTKDCVEILNQYKNSKWKRKSKFNLKPSSYGEPHVVRVFTDGIEFVTLIYNGSYVLFCKNLDLSAYKPLIEKISDLSKKYYSHDYESVWFNPWELKVWVTGGDGGIYYSEKTAREVAKLYDSGDLFEEESETPLFHEKITELKDSVFEAESDPQEYYEEDEEDIYQDNEECNYIQICHINDILNFEF
jgi:hypothetical protein